MKMTNVSKEFFLTPKENEFHSYLTKTTLETNNQLLCGITKEEQTEIGRAHV